METLKIKWRCRAGVAFTADSGNGVQLQLADGFFGQPVRPQLAPLVLELNNGVSEGELAAAVSDDYTALALLFRLLNQLRGQGLLAAEVHGPTGPLATLRPLSGQFTLPPEIATLPGQGRWRLSRFASLRREDEQWVLECTEAACDVLIEDPAVLPALADAANVPAKPASPWAQFMGLLADQGFLDVAGHEEVAAQRSWTFQDRLFHVSSRRPETYADGLRQSDERAGLVFPSAIRPAHPGETIQCPKVVHATSGSLADVMERRRSFRAMGESPVNLPTVATLLYRSVRVTRQLSNGFLLRPYPSGGAMHELEFYLAVRECEGLEPGFYHYRSHVHELTRLTGSGAAPAAAAMIEHCAMAWNKPDGPPQCLIVIATRHQRVACKYRSRAYRLSLMSAGAVLQNFYLVAADLGLHGCAAGTGRPDLFVQATGLSTWEETSIGEFGFGNAPPAADAGVSVP